MSDRKAVIKNADMSEDMQQDAVDCATQAIEKYNIEKVNNNLLNLTYNFYNFTLSWCCRKLIFHLFPRGWEKNKKPNSNQGPSRALKQKPNQSMRDGTRDY